MPAEKHTERHQKGKKNDLTERDRQSLIRKKRRDGVLKVGGHINLSALIKPILQNYISYNLQYKTPAFQNPVELINNITSMI